MSVLVRRNSRRKANHVMFLGALIVGAVSLVSGTRTVFAQANWNGSTSSDYFTAANWTTGSPPEARIPDPGQEVNIGNIPFTNNVVYNGDNGSATGQFSVMPGATFTMNSGTFLTGHMYLGNNNTVGSIATFNMTSGSVRVTGDFRTSRIAPSNLSPNSGSGTNTAYNQSGGFLFVQSGNGNNEAAFANSGSTTQVVTTAVVTGGTFMSNGRILLGASPGNVTNKPAYVKLTMSSGVMAATNISSPSSDGRGTLQFNAGDITLSGGMLRGTDISSRDGFNIGGMVPNAGIKLNGGVIQIHTNLSEGTLYVVPQGVDPTTVVGQSLNRGQWRLLDGSLNVNGGNPDVAGSGRGYSELFATGASSTSYRYAGRVWMSSGTNDAGQAKTQANGFATNPGDYNLDGKVNQADYTYLQSQMGNTYTADPLDVAGGLVAYYGADGNGDGVVTEADFNVWNDLYGQRTQGGIYAWAQPVSIDVSSGVQTQTAAGYSNLSFTTASSVTKTGAGTLVLNQANTLTGTVTIQGGDVQLAGSGNAALSATFRPVVGGKLTVAPAVQTTIDGLQVAAGGLTDVGTGKVTVAAGGLTTSEMVLALVAGRNGGAWDGTAGIVSSVAATSFGTRTVGWLENVVLDGSFNPVPNLGSVTFAYAAPGDTNLDWIVDSLDASNFAAAGKYGTGDPATWIEGDFNYDGVCDVLDAAEFANAGLYGSPAYNPPSAQLSSGIATVPEPSGFVAVGVAGLILAWRSRRRVGA